MLVGGRIPHVVFHFAHLPLRDPELKGDHLSGPLKLDQKGETKRSKGRLWATEFVLG